MSAPTEVRDLRGAWRGLSPSVALTMTLLAACLVAPRAGHAQVSVYITPSYGEWPAGSQVSATIEYCASSEQFDGPGYVWFNGQDVSIDFPFTSGGPFINCGPGTDHGTAQGTVTLVPGQNTLTSGISTWTQSGQATATYVGLVPYPPLVTPDAEPASVSPGTAYKFVFTVKNQDPYHGKTYSLSVVCTGVVSGCSVPSQLSLDNNATGLVTATYSASGALFATGVMTVTATDQSDGSQDAGWMNLTIAPSGPVVERSLCLTIAAGAGAAYECGDLRLVHALPGVRTVGAGRVPTLLYSSQHAHPYPLVSADVTLPAGDPLPTSVTATLLIGGVQYASQTWPGTAWGSPGQTRRLVVGFDATIFSATSSTGLYGYTLEVRRVTSGGPTLFQTFSGTIPIINRAQDSRFGPGWWLAGWEKLYFAGLPGGQVLWVGGDGSVRRYERGGTVGSDTAYLATPVDRPDTLLHTSVNEWVRLVPGGARVVFTANGTHRRTISRLGDSTEFVPDSTGDWRLVKIRMPRDTTLQYTFAYSSSPVRLTSVGAPDTAVGTYRTTSFNWVGDSLRVVEWAGTPDTTVVVFLYESLGTQRIIGRRDRRRTLTTFNYDAGSRLSSSRFGVPGADSIIRTFCAAEVRGLAGCGPSLVHPDSVYTAFDGPRLASDSTDIVDFWIDRLGAPFKIRDPYGSITSVARADPRWPALATRVQHPNGRIVGATYDRRGNVASVADSSVLAVIYPPQYATTHYEWDQKWDEVTLITLPNGQLTRLAYDATSGNRLWQEDGRGPVSRVTFGYWSSGNGKGLLRSVTAPGGATDSLFYDVRGNLERGKTALGWTTFVVNDRLGRTIVVRTPVSATVYRDDSTYYNRRGHASRSVSYGPPLNGAVSQRVVVQNVYNDEGQLTRLERSSVPDSAAIGVLATTWRYDVAGRRVAEVAPDGRTDSTGYDAAGNAIVVVTRRGPTLTMVYDRLNRLRRRTVPSVTYGPRSDGIAVLQLDGLNHAYNRSYSWFPGPGGSLTIPGETATFAYDTMGNLVAADNQDVRIRRTYYKDGLVENDSLWIRNYADTAFSHAYGMRSVYDASRRLVTLHHPLQLALAPYRSTQYAYDAVTGELTTVTDPLGKVWTFAYNLRGERIRLSLPGGIRDSAAYDLDGRMVKHWVKNSSGSPWAFTAPELRRDTVSYADAGRVSRISNAVLYQDVSEVKYSGLGHVVLLDTRAAVRSVTGTSTGRVDTREEFRLDAFGNTVFLKDSANLEATYHWKTGTHDRAWRYQAGTGRLRAVDEFARLDTVLYDLAGNVVFHKTDAFFEDLFPILEDRASFYGADDRLRAAEYRRLQVTDPADTVFVSGQWVIIIPQWKWPWFRSFEEYRYDALGRRVLVRTRKHCGDVTTGYLTYCSTGTIRRTVWAGDQELYEIQAYGGQEDGNATVAQMENDTLLQPVTPVSHPQGYWDPNPLLGRVAYVHGPALDQPLGLIRINLTDIPYGQPQVDWAPLVVAPHWNLRGRADLGTLGDGGWKVCLSPTSPRCMHPIWEVQSFAFLQPFQDAGRWFGTLIREKEDWVGLQYRRNRYVDPATGRFTQEDPIGLAGGLNLYGFAAGDPVNFSDPFGLCPGWWSLICRAGAALLSRVGIRIGVAGVGTAAATTGRIAQSPTAQRVAADATAVASRIASSLGPTTQRLVDAVRSAGSSIEARSDAVQQVVKNLDVVRYTDVLDDAGTLVQRTISGGVGDRLREIILRGDGSATIRAFNASRNVWDVVSEIKPQ
ncbi:MAG: RHS repeat-associated core domain-containing protein [Tepidiformaceae bacterium]